MASLASATVQGTLRYLVTTTPAACYPTASEAMASVGIAADTEQAALAAQSAGTLSVTSDFIIGIHYDGLNWTGSTMTVVGSNCSGGWPPATISWSIATWHRAQLRARSV